MDQKLLNSKEVFERILNIISEQNKNVLSLASDLQDSVKFLNYMDTKVSNLIERLEACEASLTQLSPLNTDTKNPIKDDRQERNYLS